MTRGGAKTSSQQSRKDYISGGSFDVWKTLLEEENNLYPLKIEGEQLYDTYPILLSSTHCGNKSILRVLRIILVILPEHPSETKVFHNEDGNPARANIKQALGRLCDSTRIKLVSTGKKRCYERSHKGVKASANSDIIYFFTSAQDGDPLQDDVATNGASSDRRDILERSKKCSWDNNRGRDNNRGQKNKDRFSPYRGPNHGLLPSLSKSPKEILAMKKAVRSFEQPPKMFGSKRSRDMSKYCHFREDYGHDTNDYRHLKTQNQEAVNSG
ncbi:hypothetical protein Tco_0485502 [Tanacetum coccineum]